MLARPTAEANIAKACEGGQAKHVRPKAAALAFQAKQHANTMPVDMQALSVQALPLRSRTRIQQGSMYKQYNGQ